MTVVLTRPFGESEKLARTLAAQGIETLVAPMLSIEQRRPDDLETELEQAQAILLTSANGARALANATDRRDLNMFVVGDATADAARSEGFTDIESADGEVADLAKLAIERLTPEDGFLLHVSGQQVAGDIEGALSSVGFAYRRVVLYDAVAADALPETLRTALRDKSANAVLFYSPRSARTFVELARESDVESSLKSATAYCLSDAVADAAERNLWDRVVVADRPRSDSLVERLIAGEAAAKPRNQPEKPRDTMPLEDRNPPSTMRPWLPVAVSAVIAVVLSVFISYAFRSAPSDDGTAQSLTEMETRLQSLASQNEALSDRMADIQAEQQARADVVERLAAAEAQLAELAAAPEATVEEADLEALRQELAATRAILSEEIDRVTQPMAVELSALSGTVDGLAGHLDRIAAQDLGATGALLLAVGQLRAAALGPGPFAHEVDAVRDVTGNAPEIAKPLSDLAPWAVQGVATLASLTDGFQDAATAILRADDLPEDAGWFETAYAEVKGLVSVRRVGEDVAGDDPQAVLARAEVSLAIGDVAAAVALVESVDGAQRAAGDWLDAARGRSAVGAALDELSRIALTRAATANTTP